MRSFNEWLYLRDKVYYESFIFLEQGGPSVAPKVVEIPEGSGRLFWQIDDPDNPGKKVHILTTSPNAQERALELIQRNKEMAKTAPAGAAPAPGALPTSTSPAGTPPTGTPPTGTPPTGTPPVGAPPVDDDMDASYINPKKIDARNVQVGSYKMQLSARNMMIKRMIAEKKNTSVSSITDKIADEQLAYMANEEDEKEFMQMDGTKVDLKKIQQAFVDRYGYNKEMQLFNGATQENIRLSPKNWAGITIKAGKLSPRQPAPKGATIIPYGATGKPVTLTPKEIQAEKEEAERSKLILKNAYGEDPSKWQKSAQVAAGLIKDPLLNQASVYFMKFFDQYGADYRKWSPPQQKAAGIDPKTPYYSVEQSKQQDVLSIYEDKQTNKDEKNNLLKQYIDSKNGLKNLSNYDIYWLAYGIGDQNKTFNNSFMSPQEAKDLLNRKDLDPTTISFLKQIAGNENQQPSQQQQTPNGQENQALGGTGSVKQISLIQDESKRNEELKKYIASKGGLDKLDNQDIDNLVASIAGFGDYSDDNIKSGQTKLKRLDKSFLNSQQAQELLKRMDLDEFTIKNLKQFISGQNTQQPPAANKSADEKAKRQDEIKKELKDIDEQFKEISDLITLASGKEGPDKCYNDNKNIFDDYAERKKIDKNIVEILKKLVNDEYGLEERQKNLKDEAEKLNKQ
jgi:hypothetical protein